MATTNVLFISIESMADFVCEDVYTRTIALNLVKVTAHFWDFMIMDSLWNKIRCRNYYYTCNASNALI